MILKFRGETEVISGLACGTVDETVLLLTKGLEFEPWV